MNKLLYGLSVAFLFSCNSKNGNSFTIEGSVKNGTIKTVYLEQNSTSNPLIIDSAKVDGKGNFVIKTTTREEEALFSLRGDDNRYPFALLVNDSKNITVAADLANEENRYTVKGSSASESIREFDRTLRQNGTIMYELYQKISGIPQPVPGDTNSARSTDSVKTVLFTQFQQKGQEMKNYTSELVARSTSPTVTLYAFALTQQMFGQFGMKGFNRMETAEIVAKAESKFPGNVSISEWKKTLGPSKAQDFTMTDTSGNAVALSSFRGKYVLLDFWASWCGPCRQENPNVVNAYRQFSNKNFTIVGVSLDNSKGAWIKAIHDDGLQWNHLSDLKGWKNEAALLYGINSIPSNLLLDPQGNIIAEDLSGQLLVNTLQQVLK